ncbi:3-ketoacyl-CoA thiolase [Pseudonocardia sp. N23]|nr:3-ketoacyl-CoA thiolase [Pseudonocardia sp. N23]
MIAGVGCTRFGDLVSTPGIAGLSLQELAAAAAREALEDAGMRGHDVGALYAGNATGQSSGLPATHTQLARWVGLNLKPGVRIDAAGSTTNVAIVMAAEAIASGAIDSALVLGVEADRSRPKGLSPYEREPIPPDLLRVWTDQSCDQAYAVPQGHDMIAACNGIVAQGYMRRYSMSAKDYDRAMFEVCRTRRLHGALNPRAVLQQRLEDEAAEHGFADPFDFWRSSLNPFASWPARRRSLATPADGASAVVLVRGEAARGLPHRSVTLRGFGTAAADVPWYTLDPTNWRHDAVAIHAAFTMAGITGADIDHLHTDDSSHILGIVAAERTGYLPYGEGLEAASAGRLRFDGDKPMSTHGGRHAFGHASSASAGSDTYEAVMQIRGRAGAAQMPSAPGLSVVATHGRSLISQVLVLEGN